jgi:hypothetical protein
MFRDSDAAKSTYFPKENPVPADQTLQGVIDLINTQAQRTAPRPSIFNPTGLPHVPPPTIFQPDPPQTGFDPAEAQALRRILDALNPRVKERVTRIDKSPSAPPATAKLLRMQGLDPMTYLGGVFEKPSMFVDTGRLWLNPDRNVGTEQAKTLYHELGHAGGMDERMTTLLSQALQAENVHPNAGGPSAAFLALKALLGLR